MGSQEWEALHAAGLPDYLRAAGVIRRSEVVGASRSSGRNRVFSVSVGGEDGPRWFVKQFGPSDFDGVAFEREREITTSLDADLVVVPEHVDAEWRVLVFPAFGESLYEKVRSGTTMSRDLGLGVRANLRGFQAHSANVSADPPAILQWLRQGPDYRELSIAQRRLTTTLKHSPSVEPVVRRAAETWSAEPRSVLCHGDLKLEHVLISGLDEKCRCVDWELARSGPPEWDLAGLAQSMLAYVVLGLIEWSPGARRFLLALLVDVDVESPAFAERVALRLWQTAIEWETDSNRLSGGSAQLCQFGVNLTQEPGRLGQLLSGDA